MLLVEILTISHNPNEIDHEASLANDVRNESLTKKY